MLQSYSTSHHVFNQEDFILNLQEHVPNIQQSIWSYINTCAVMTVVTWAELRWDCRIEPISASQSQSATNNIKILFKHECKENTKTPNTQQCDSAIELHRLYKIRTAQTIVTTNNFRFFAEQKEHAISHH